MGCSLYYECVGLTPVLMSCPVGLYFDSRINVCNWPEYVDCNESTTSTTTASTTTTETSTNSTTNRIKRSADFDVVCHESEDGYAVFVPHPFDCSLYYECVDLTPVLMSCPAGLYFDSRVNTCNWPENVDCDDGTSTTTTTTASTTTSPDFDVVCHESEDGYAVFVPHPYDCSLYYECVGLTPVLMSCPADL